MCHQISVSFGDAYKGSRKPFFDGDRPTQLKYEVCEKYLIALPIERIAEQGKRQVDNAGERDMCACIFLANCLGFLS